MSTEAAPPMIAVRRVSKSFGAVKVLKDVSLAVARGEAVVVIGPSGSGKTTLLRCINLLEEFEEGEIYVDGDPIGYRIDKQGRRTRRSEREVAASRSNIGIVFQSYNLFPHMTVLRNITAAPTRVKGVPADVAEARGSRAPRARRPCREGGRVPDAPLRRAAAAGRDRPRTRYGAEGDALRRDHLGARPGVRWRGPGRDAAN